MRTPVLSAVGWINRENVMRGGADQPIVDHEEAGIEILIQAGVVAAQHFQSANAVRIDLAERRVSLRGEGPVVARPASGVGWFGIRSRRRIGHAGCTDGRHRWSVAQLYDQCAWRAIRGSKGVQRQSYEGDRRQSTETQRQGRE
jgi:hypothetical protein